VIIANPFKKKSFSFSGLILTSKRLHDNLGFDLVP